MRLESAHELAKKRSEMHGQLPDIGVSGVFSTEHTFKLIDIRGYSYLDMEGILVFME